MDLLYKSLENLFHTNIKNISMKKYFIKIHNKKNLPQLYENQIEREIIGTSDLDYEKEKQMLLR